MYIDATSGLLVDARQCPTPNCDDRPPGCTVDLLVVHNISLPPGEFGGDAIDALFCNRLDPSAHPYFVAIAELRVSAHLLIRRDGEVVQYVPLHRRAWHAGVSSFNGRPGCNDYSIGVELEGTDDEAYTDVQYRRLAAITLSLFALYPAMSSERIAGHCDVAPDRKTDPGPAFDWDFYKRMLARSELAQRIPLESRT